MPREIFSTIGMAESIRYSEYKNINSAISEIVDNSIEAKAKNIGIIMYISQREGNDKIIKLAVIDDGIGMDQQTLQDCLVFGSINKNGRSSIGRFGVGLGQASLYASSRVEIYSWQDCEKPMTVFLDTDRMKRGEQKEIPTPFISDFPAEFSGFKTISSYFNGDNIDYRTNGTMVVWTNVDKINNRVSTFERNLEEELGRRFRYYISKGVNIFITDTVFSKFLRIKAIDPMFLMPNSKYLGDSKNTQEVVSSEKIGEPIFEPLNEIGFINGAKILRVTIDDIKDKPTVFGNVVIRASVVKEKFYYQNLNFDGGRNPNPGETKIGKVLSKFENISMLRVSREIQFEKFGLYDSVNKPTNRWWSIEVEFDSSLDELFKLSNNKQKIEVNVSPYSSTISLKHRNPEFESKEEEFWYCFVLEVKNAIKFMTSRNKKIADKYSRRSSRNELEVRLIVDVDKEIKTKSKNDTTEFASIQIANQISSDRSNFEKEIWGLITENSLMKDPFCFEGFGMTSKLVINRSSEINLMLTELSGEISVLTVLVALNETRKQFNTHDSSRFFDSMIKTLIQKLTEIATKGE